MGSPTLYLDIEGVLSCYGYSAPETGLDYRPLPGQEYSWYCPQVIDQVSQLEREGLRIVWLSCVDDQAGFFDRIGLEGHHWPSLRRHQGHSAFASDWKLLSLVEDVHAHRPADWLWVEDGLLGTTAQVISHRRVLVTESSIGLLPEHLEMVRDRLLGRAQTIDMRRLRH